MVAKAKVRIEGEDATAAAWRSAANQAQASAKKISGFFKFAIGAASLTAVGSALTSAAKQAIDFGDQINKASIKAGIGNKAMSELAYAAKLADVDIASLSTALKKMQVSLSEAGTGAKGPTTALAALGLTIGEVQKRKPEAQFELLADRISKLKDPADRARAAVELFGKAGADLLPLFEQGAAGIAKARAEAEKLGLSFSDDQIKKLAEADDSIKRLDASWKGFATTLTSVVAPTISHVLDMLAGNDSRSEQAKSRENIRSLEARIQRARDGLDFLTPDQLSGLETELSNAKGRRDLLNGPSLAGTGGGRGRGSFVVGFQAADAAQKAEEAAKKAGEAALKEEEKLAAEREDLFAHTDENISKHYFEELEERSIAQMEFDNDVAENAKELAEKTAAWREEQSKKLSESAQIFKDAFLNAWDDMVNNGKFRIDELFKYIIAEFARRGIAKLFDSIFAGGGSAGSSGGGILATAGKFVSGLFGGGRANGGPMEAGKFYEVGERGRELFAPGMNGTMIPNHALGGGQSFVINNNIDARGADIGMAKRWPQLAKQISEATEARIVERLGRRAYNL